MWLRNRIEMHNIPTSDIQFTVSDQLWHDVLLMKISSKTIAYALKSEAREWKVCCYVPEPDGYWKVKKCQNTFAVQTRRFASKHMKKRITDQWEEVCNEKEISIEVGKFYQTLYEEKEKRWRLQIVDMVHKIPNLSDEEVNIEGKITLE